MTFTVSKSIDFYITEFFFKKIRRSNRLLGGYCKTNTNLFSFPKNTEVRILNNKVQRMEVAIDRNRQLGRETKQVLAKNDTFLKRNKQIKKTIILGMIPK